MNAYSMDLRHKIVEALSIGTPKARVARASGVGLSTVKRYAGGAQRGESLTSRKPPGKRRKVYGITQRLLERDLEERPTATLPQRRELLARVAGVELSDCTVSRALRRMGFGRKKDCEYCDHGARDVSPRWSDPKKGGLRAFPAIRRPLRRASRRRRSESRVTS
jgi:transposase